MFDLAWSEIALIGVVALVVIGPKDLPEAIRGVARGIQKLRRMAAEFQTHADELVREAKLDEVRNQINEVKSAVNEIRSFDLRTEIEKSVDSDGTIRKTFQDDPLKTDWSAPGATGGEPVITTPAPEAQGAASAGLDPAPPAFIPPDAVPPPALPPAAGPVPATPLATDPVAATVPPAMDPLAASAPLPPAREPAPHPASVAAPQPAPVPQKA